MRTIFFPFFIIIALTAGLCTGTYAQKKNKKSKENEQEDKKAANRLSEKEQQQVNYYFFSGLREKTLNNFQLAAGFFKKCLEVDPDNDAALFELALLYRSGGQLNEGLELAKKAAAINKEEDWYIKLVAQILEDKQDYKGAAACYLKLIDKNPDNINYYFDYASMLLYTSQFNEAIKVYDKIQARTGINEEMSQQKQKIYLKLGKVDKAIEEMKNLINSNPGEVRYYLLLADLYSANNLQEEAYKTYQQALLIDQENGYARLGLADYYRNKGDAESSFREVKNAFELKSMDIDTKVKVLFPYFSLLEQADIKQKALELANILVKVHPSEAKAHSIYGDFLLQDSLDTLAREEYRKAIQLDGKIYALWDQLIRLDLSLNDFESALKESTEALSIFPNQTLLYLYNGIANSQLARNKEAVEMLNNGISIGSENTALMAQLYSSLGDAYHSLKKERESDNAYEKSLELQPNQAYVLNNYSYYLSLRNTQLEKAEEMAKKANSLEPNNSSFEDTYAWVLYKMGRMEEAKIWIEKALANGGNQSATVMEHYGDILFKLGKTETALASWKKAKEIGAKSDMLDKKINDGTLYE